MILYTLCKDDSDSHDCRDIDKKRKAYGLEANLWIKKYIHQHSHQPSASLDKKVQLG